MAQDGTIEQLRPAIKAGDSAAYRQLVHRLSESLYIYATMVTRDRDEAEDVVQRTFIELYRGRARLRNTSASGSLSTYCFRIATNLARKSLRAKALLTPTR